MNERPALSLSLAVDQHGQLIVPCVGSATPVIGMFSGIESTEILEEYLFKHDCTAVVQPQIMRK
jgi:hypothetical protein